MKDYFIELAKFSGKCVVVFIFAFVFIEQFSNSIFTVYAIQDGVWSVETYPAVTYK